MKTSSAKTAIAIRQWLSVKRIHPRRLYMVEDGAYRWIGDRADLSAPDARALKAITDYATDPSRHPADGISAEAYTEICGRCPCLAATHGAAGIVSWEDLPEDWQSGFALGPIAPIYLAGRPSPSLPRDSQAREPGIRESELAAGRTT